MAASSRPPAAPCRCCCSTISPIWRGCRATRRCTTAMQEAIDPCWTCRTMPAISACGAPGSDADPWISVYALDFLFQAKAKGYVVPNDALKRGANWLKPDGAVGFRRRRRPRLCLLCAGAHRPGEHLATCAISAIRKGPEMKTAIAAALTGAAAAEVGRPSARQRMASAGRARSCCRPIRADYPHDRLWLAAARSGGRDGARGGKRRGAS